MTKKYDLLSCRSPHGERGLKSCVTKSQAENIVVALLTESVDWNISCVSQCRIQSMSLSSRRAWIEIMVGLQTSSPPRSLSSRRAWIEILTFHCFPQTLHVALLTESVDWNYLQRRFLNNGKSSLSSRRAWIEIKHKLWTTSTKIVALLTESVDWNKNFSQ